MGVCLRLTIPDQPCGFYGTSSSNPFLENPYPDRHLTIPAAVVEFLPGTDCHAKWSLAYGLYN